MRDKVLITGASGFLGYHLINAAIEANLEVHAAVRKQSDVKHLENLPIIFIQLNYQDVDSMATIIKNEQYKYIIHAAGITKANNDSDYDLINNVYTTNFALAAAKNANNIKKFVFISSLAACGPLFSTNGIIDETLEPKPVTAYGISKLKAEQNILKLDLPFTILRPTAIYGPREKDIFIIANYINKGFELYIGKFDQKLSFVHGKDVGDIGVKALFKHEVNGIFNITDGHEYTRYDFASIIKEHLNKKVIQFHISIKLVATILFVVERVNKFSSKALPVNREKLGELLAKNWSCDISKVKRELNFTPKYDLNKGLAETINWYKINKWL